MKINTKSNYNFCFVQDVGKLREWWTSKKSDNPISTSTVQSPSRANASTSKTIRDISGSYKDQLDDRFVPNCDLLGQLLPSSSLSAAGMIKLYHLVNIYSYNRQKVVCLYVRFLRSFKLKFGRNVELDELSNIKESCIAKF